MTTNLDRSYDPMTIENAVDLRLTGVMLYCRKCRREGQASFDAVSRMPEFWRRGVRCDCLESRKGRS
jgi:hypothetical protein